MAIVGPFPKRQSVPVSKCSADVIVYEYLFVCAVWRRRRHCTYVLHVSVHLDAQRYRYQSQSTTNVSLGRVLQPTTPLPSLLASRSLLRPRDGADRRRRRPGGALFSLTLCLRSRIPRPRPPRSQFRCTCMCVLRKSILSSKQTPIRASQIQVPTSHFSASFHHIHTRASRYA